MIGNVRPTSTRSHMISYFNESAFYAEMYLYFFTRFDSVAAFAAKLRITETRAAEIIAKGRSIVHAK